jgi:N-acetyl-gamma-glutamyl-phosphate/LysW-gamma-L-alpha-aminoadipyl-6-phosphate reductase
VVRVGVVGASGYIGGELLRILLKHPGVELSFATSRTYAGEYLFRVHPNLRGFTEMKFSNNETSLMTEADLVFTALPHGQSFNLIQELEKTGIRIIDMSADFRLKDASLYKLWYGREHPNPEMLKNFVYSVPELNRDDVRNSRLASSPGCMAITSILALVPFAKKFSFDSEKVVIDAKIGSSGSGGKPSISTHFSERYNVVRPYRPAGHRHEAEIEQALDTFSGVKARVSMSAHAVNMVRGILCTTHLFLRDSVSLPEIWRAYREFYSGSRFIRLVRDRKGPFRLPDPKLVIGSNFCDIGFEIDEKNKRAVLVSATDNLVKGAAGNAVQTMNLMLNLREEEGLDTIPLHPV